MAKNLKEMRFAVKDVEGNISSIWKLWVSRHGDIYLASRSSAHISKYSFHKSGINRNAFTSQAWGNNKGDRLQNRWKRGIPPNRGEGKAHPLAFILMPTNYLSRQTVEVKKNTVWLQAAPTNQATIFELSLTYESEHYVKNNLSSLPEPTLICYQSLPDDLGLVMCYYHAECDNKNLKILGPGTGPIPEDLMISDQDPDNTGRPFRFHMTNPTLRDGQALTINDVGAYKFFNCLSI